MYTQKSVDQKTQGPVSQQGSQSQFVALVHCKCALDYETYYDKNP